MINPEGWDKRLTHSLAFGALKDLRHDRGFQVPVVPHHVAKHV